MRAFYSDSFVLPLPEGHRFPMAKYARLRERVVATGLVPPHRLVEAPPADWDFRPEASTDDLPVVPANFDPPVPPGDEEPPKVPIVGRDDAG